MFSFFKRQEKVVFPFGELLEVDMHSHVLPGIDDGAPDVATAERLISGLRQLGYRSIVATPHIMADIHRNNPQTIQAAHVQLGSVRDYSRVGYAAEYMLDEGFSQLIAERSLLTIGGRNRVLVETPYLHRPFGLETHIFEMITAGYVPVLAHPERYHYLFGDRLACHRLKELGCLFQSNLLSMTGYYGRKEKETAHWLLGAGLVDFLGTDLHHDRHLRLMSNFQIDQQMVKILEGHTFLNTTCLTGRLMDSVD